MNANPAELRRALMEHGLAHHELSPSPIEQFQDWYELALSTDLPEPNGMTLCTVDADGQPSARTVLLKLYDARGFVFFTNYESRKAKEIEQNPRVALLFPWVALARQVQITGRAERISTTESLSYFATRPRGSQIGAWSSPQSQVISSRSILEGKVAEMARKFAKGEIPLPDFWGGYRVIPRMIEFWQGRESRLHDRFRYIRSDDRADEWSIERLAP
ncbi:pyridoxamine 5'-phosphate oxidase [Thiorhodococcus mannitoliphagus]|uniref:Pyridoxine/pyridoxamine 5'-phosphate oxidase n=1 Tax=Thiorhodococcus mannitoliphagus TaxID=329406 RepID=A0A6P1DYN4_9GAMM|nr:pyridoxamine 5'-phosphate oxidase [Thiorhodococcus mannitoliphagus]NEX20675.1 pyridoxamine 5'-phosphate oxidase [Thiorhodococcus mannitoliphagus]